MTYTNWTMQKSELNDEEYAAVAEWCNEGNEYTIEDKGDYYAVVKIPEPTEEEKAERVREIRNQYLEEYVDKVVSNPLRWADMTEEEQQQIKDYRQYLLDIPQQEAFPDIEVLTFEQWLAMDQAEATA